MGQYNVYKKAVPAFKIVADVYNYY